LTILTLAIAAVVAGTPIVLNYGIQVVSAAKNGPPSGSPYGALVSSEAHVDDDDNKKGFGDDIKRCRDGGGCQGDGNNGIDDFRANPSSGKEPGKAGETRDETNNGHDDD
jgi:hypothetical protein